VRAARAALPYLAVTETARFRRAVFFRPSFIRVNESWPIGQNRTIRHASHERVVKIAVIA